MRNDRTPWRVLLQSRWSLAVVAFVATGMIQLLLTIDHVESWRATARPSHGFMAFVCGPLWILSAAFAGIALSRSPGRPPALASTAIVYTGIIAFLVLPSFHSLDAQAGLLVAVSALVGYAVSLAGTALAIVVFSAVNDNEPVVPH